MARQGYALSESEIEKIVRLLKTDMDLQQIALRMGCSTSTVNAINRRFKVRQYAGRRSTWQTQGFDCVV